MKNNKGFTLTELLVSFALITVVIIYLLKATTNVMMKENDLLMLQEYNVFSSTLLNKFYEDIDGLDNFVLETNENNIYIKVNNSNDIYKTISFVNDNGNRGIYYDNVLYELPDDVSFKNEGFYSISSGTYDDESYIKNYFIIDVPMLLNKKSKNIRLILQNTNKNINIPEPQPNVNYLINSAPSGSTTAYLEGPIKKNEIETIKFETSKNVPSDAIGNWDVSNEGNGSVMAWYKDEDNDSLYELYIGQNGGVRANPNSSHLFRYLINVTNIDLTNLDTSNVTTMESMFYNCTSLTSLDLSNFNTSKVSNMSSMFNSLSLTNLDLSNFDTSNVINMSNMFRNSTLLTDVDLSSFNTSKVTDMSYMFRVCSSLTNLDLSNFNTSNVINMSNMFDGAQKLSTTITISNASMIDSSYSNMFVNAATNSSTKIIVNYTSETSSLVDNMIATKSSKSNVVKGKLIG